MNEILAWGTRAIVVALAATLLAVTTQSLAQEGTAPLPPQVIAVQPYPGEEVLAGQAVTLIFDEAMDAASVGPMPGTALRSSTENTLKTGLPGASS